MNAEEPRRGLDAGLSAVFDMDGVIVDNRDYHFRAWEEFTREHALPFDAESFKNNLFGRVNRDILRGLYGRELPPEEAAALAREKEARYRRLYAGRVAPAPGLVEFLRELRSAGITTAVATAAPRVNLDFVLDEAGLRPAFDALIDISLVARGKPAPDLYLQAAEALGREPHACVAFEDSFPGVESALAAGMIVVGVTTTHTAAELPHTHLVVPDFRGLTAATVRALLKKGHNTHFTETGPARRLRGTGKTRK